MVLTVHLQSIRPNGRGFSVLSTSVVVVGTRKYVSDVVATAAAAAAAAAVVVSEVFRCWLLQ